MPLSLIHRRAAGQVDSGITVQRQTTTVGASGLPVETFADHLKTTAMAATVPGDEAIRYGRESSRQLVRFHVAAGQDIRADDRVVWNGTTYQIIAVRTPGGRQAGDRLAWTVLDTEEVTT